MMPRRAICAGRSRVMSVPLNTIWPDVGSRNLVRRLKQVVLPAPLGPINAWMEPRRTRRFTPLTAVKPLNSFVRPRVSRIVSPRIMSPSVLVWALALRAGGALLAPVLRRFRLGLTVAFRAVWAALLGRHRAGLACCTIHMPLGATPVAYLSLSRQ